MTVFNHKEQSENKTSNLMRKYEINYKNNDKIESVMTFLDTVTEKELLNAVLKQLELEEKRLSLENIEIVSVFRR